MAMITTVLPIAFGLFSLQFPAGLVLYFLISNLWRLGQQELIMRKITRPGQAQARGLEAKDDDVIDVEGGDTSAFPRAAAGGLRKLFQIPAAANGDEPAAETGNGAKNGAEERLGQAEQHRGCGQGRVEQGLADQGHAGQGTPAGSSSGSSSGSGANSGARRRNNKKRKRR